ncbi:MAG TPA: MFS transporter, partial [Stellaceae bacterium]|nr:MFS transporter [Stellaceae bacterium]
MADAAGTTTPQHRTARPGAAVEGRGSWVAAAASLVVLSFSYGSPLLLVVGLKPIASGLGADREAVSLAAALMWIGTGTGGILMGWLADRIGIRRTVVFGATMIAAGLLLSSLGRLWALYVGQGLLMGLLGNGAMMPPLMVYVSRWFEARRGTALALISSGQYVAGMVWPSVFERAMTDYGWQRAMVGFAAVCAVTIPLIALFLYPAPPPHAAEAHADRQRTGRQVLGMPPNLVMALLCVAGFCCCIPMALPQSHLVAFCTDVGITPTSSALMLSVMTGAAFLSRQFWGWLADRVGGLPTLLLGSTCQALAISAFLMTRSEAGLFAVSAAYGLGFSGIVPAYVLIVRELFPSSEAAWRVPLVLFVSMGGMAFGSWFAGAIYDHFGFYGPAFATGVLFNLANMTVVGFLVLRRGWGRRLHPAAA